ncbi:MAG: PDDEXK nuclease domain-containing protein [Propionibacteriaceae bacterium]|jgi:predicted nuclease of restriction endonuclease-like (RecB) superfamily|nr:PDDEXK nuclease domain-containing protein [Propionibacteriaceae bacterium]
MITYAVIAKVVRPGGASVTDAAGPERNLAAVPREISPAQLDLADQAPIVQQPVGQLGELPPQGYADLLADVKHRIRSAQVRAVRAANTEMLRLYWSVGHDILLRQAEQGWGSGVITRLAADLRREFPEQTGWSRTNLHYMRQVAEVWPTEIEFVQQPVGQLPWGHIVVLLGRLDSRGDRDWYAARAVDEGWSRNVMNHFIATGLRDRIGAAPTNFHDTLDSPDSELAQQLVKDPYVFDHLAMVRRRLERDVEQALMDRLQDTLTEFGRGMAFVARQPRFEVADPGGRIDELVPDLLLFHIPQSRYVVIELKLADFEPAALGQLAAYVGVVDAQLRDPATHAPTIGILLCTGKNETLVRYTLANMSAPMGVADYAGLPADIQAALPSPAALQSALDDEQAERARQGAIATPVQPSAGDDPSATPADVVAAFQEYVAERADAGVMLAKAVTSISLAERVVHVTFDPAAVSMDADMFQSLNVFDNLAEVVGVPIAFKNDQGERLRPLVDAVATAMPDGTDLGTLATGEIYQIGTGESWHP